MNKKEIPLLTASQLSKLIETKEVSPVEAPLVKILAG